MCFNFIWDKFVFKCVQHFLLILFFYTSHPHLSSVPKQTPQPPSAKGRESLLHVQKGHVCGSAQEADQQSGTDNYRRVLLGHTKRHRQDGRYQDVVDVAQNPREGRALHHTLVVRFQVDTATVAPVATGEAEELEAV